VATVVALGLMRAWSEQTRETNIESATVEEVQS
jgi:hypothetical protein